MIRILERHNVDTVENACKSVGTLIPTKNRNPARSDDVLRSLQPTQERIPHRKSLVALTLLQIIYHKKIPGGLRQTLILNQLFIPGSTQETGTKQERIREASH